MIAVNKTRVITDYDDYIPPIPALSQEIFKYKP